jgi:hypothetical protein
MNSPWLVFLLVLIVQWLSAQAGDLVRKKFPFKEEERDDFTVVVGAMLTLLGLLIGFAFSMAVTRYDLRKNYEEAEANAIGTEYVRADLLPAQNAALVRELLKKYLDQRILFYETRGQRELDKVNADTAGLQNQLWAAVRSPATTQPTPITALAVAGMNDVLNSQGYTQAAWWNRIPTTAWFLMTAIAICCNLLLGYSARHTERSLSVILPLAVSLSFLLISDIDSPRRGAIRVVPQNLVSLAQSLQTP